MLSGMKEKSVRKISEILQMSLYIHTNIYRESIYILNNSCKYISIQYYFRASFIPQSVWDSSTGLDNHQINIRTEGEESIQ